MDVTPSTPPSGFTVMDAGLAGARARWRVQTDLIGLGLVVLWTLVGLGLVYRTPQAFTLDPGSSFARPHLRGFYPPEHNAAHVYAFTGERAQLFVPGAGGGLFATTLRINGFRPTTAEPARVRIGRDSVGVTVSVTPLPRSYHVLVPATSGDLAVGIATTTFRGGPADPRRLGIPLQRFTAHALAGRVPSRTALILLAVAVGLYALGRRLDVAPAVSLAATLLLVSLGLYGLAAARLLITVGLVRWLVVLLGLHVALGPGHLVIARLYRRIELPLGVAEEHWLWRIAAVATLVKLGGILYPHAILFDQAAHVARMTWILAGRFMDLYRPGATSGLGRTVGLHGGQLPYSPLWYLIVVPFHFVGLSLADATNGLSGLMDVSKLFPIHIIGRKTTGSVRVGLLAAGLYHVIPMPYFLLSWGNYPTQFGLWASLLAIAYLVARWERVSHQHGFWVWVALIALAILAYTIVGVFTVTLLLFVGLLGLLQKGSRGDARLRFILGGMLVAELVCFAIYHVQYVSAVVHETLPAVVRGTGERLDAPPDALADARANALANVVANTLFMLAHFTGLILILAVAGVVLAAGDDRARRWWPLWAAWGAVFVVYTLVSAYIADLVLKHVFFMMPMVCIAAGLALARLSRRGRWGQAVVVLVVLLLAVQVVDRGHSYLLVKRHEPTVPSQ